MADESGQNRRWWQTMPGALTAIAGLITAITGLIVAVNQLGLGWNDDHGTPGAAVNTVATSQDSGVAKKVTEGTGTPAVFSVSFPSGAKATLGDSVYRIVGTRVEQRNPGELGLRLTVRMTNNSPYPANFWASTFRLLVHGVARAPTDDLNEVVDGNSSQDGAVTFAVPESVRTLSLLLLNANEKLRIPIKLSRKQA